VTEKKLLDCLILHSCVFLLTELAVLKIEAALHFFSCGVSALLCLSKAHVSWSISSCRSKHQRKEKPWEKRV